MINKSKLEHSGVWGKISPFAHPLFSYSTLKNGSAKSGQPWKKRRQTQRQRQIQTQRQIQEQPTDLWWAWRRRHTSLRRARRSTRRSTACRRGSWTADQPKTWRHSLAFSPPQHINIPTFQLFQLDCSIYPLCAIGAGEALPVPRLVPVSHPACCDHLRSFIESIKFQLNSTLLHLIHFVANLSS